MSGRGLLPSIAIRTGTRWVDLDPVAGGVLRRQHRELRSGPGTDRRDATLEHEAGVGVEADFGRLADAHVVEVGFLEVGFDVGALVGDQGQHRQAGDRLLADLQPVGLGDAAGDRRADVGAAQRQLAFGLARARPRRSADSRPAPRAPRPAWPGPRAGSLRPAAATPAPRRPRAGRPRSRPWW